MAGWEVHGYVQDSEEEEEGLSDKSESQKRDGGNLAPAEDLDPLDEAEGSQQGGGCKDDTGLETQRRQSLDEEDREEEFEEVRVVAGRHPSPFRDLLSSSQETDELQAGHYHAQERTRPQPGSVEEMPGRGSRQHVMALVEPPSSSPLTLPSSTPASHSLSPKLPPRPEDYDSQSQGNELPPPEGPASQGSQLASKRTRNLRQRNPIQLHPYAIEGEKYRQTLKGSGLKPLRIAQVESQVAAALQDDSQGGEFLAGADSQDELLQMDLLQSSSPVVDSRDSIGPQTQPTLGTFEDDEGELPDMEAILRRMPSTYAVNGHKRRRVLPSLAGGNRQRPTFKNPTEAFQLHDEATGDGDEMFNIPPSPPDSQTPKSSSSTRPRSRGFRFPPSMPPIVLPTPATSSEPRRQARPMPEASHSESSISLSEESGDETEASHSESSPTLGEESGGETEASASETRQVRDRRLEGIQRKIRGVLPASWLKLDLETQAKKPTETAKRHETTAPRRGKEPQRGVARAVVSRCEDPMNTDDIEQLL
ncbi:MAG: hypothetical protein L6R39_007545, partial [Caloplaca ligustica]